MKSERKEQRVQNRTQAVHVGCSAFYQVGPRDFLSALPAPVLSLTSDSIKGTCDSLLTPPKARNITRTMNKIFKKLAEDRALGNQNQSDLSTLSDFVQREDLSWTKRLLSFEKYIFLHSDI